MLSHQQESSAPPSSPARASASCLRNYSSGVLHGQSASPPPPPRGLSYSMLSQVVSRLSFSLSSAHGAKWRRRIVRPPLVASAIATSCNVTGWARMSEPCSATTWGACAHTTDRSFFAKITTTRIEICRARRHKCNST